LKRLCSQALPFVLAGSPEELPIATDPLEALRLIKRSVNVEAVKIREAVGRVRDAGSTIDPGNHVVDQFRGIVGAYRQ
jgi:hypothetical protein